MDPVTETVSESAPEPVEPAGLSVAKASKIETEKPWVKAGFQTREAWRASKGQKSAKKPNGEAKAEKKEAKPKAEKPKKEKKEAKPKAEKKPKVKRKANGKSSDKPAKSAKEREEAHARVLAFKRSLSKREEPSEKEAKVLSAFGGKSKACTIAELGAEAFPSRTKPIQKSWVRNALRWLVASKSVKKIDRGTYQRI